MITLRALTALLIFPGGLFVLALGLGGEWLHRKLVARLQNRLGPRWFQPLADVVKLLSKEWIVPAGADTRLWAALPVVALAGALTAALYVPLAGLAPAYSFPGDLVVTLYLLSLLSLATSLAGVSTPSRFAAVGATRTLTQLFAYEAPFLLALLGPAMAAGSWQIGEVAAAGSRTWMVLTQPVGFVIALLGLMGKLELPPFDAPEAETEIVAGALTEYSGWGLALFRLARSVELAVGVALIAALYLGGTLGLAAFAVKTLALLACLSLLRVLISRLRIDQTMSLWWRAGALLAVGQLMLIIVVKGVVV
jgi:NADH-quinone oxidoreductase subunit H